MPVPTRLANDGWWLCSFSARSSIDAPPSPAKASQRQMKSISIAARHMPALFHGFPSKLTLAVAMTGFADWLFYDHRVGISLVLFLLSLVSVSLLSNRVPMTAGHALVTCATLAAGLAPLVEDLNFLSVLFGILTVAIVISRLTNPFIEEWRDYFRALRSLLLAGPFRLVADIVRSGIGSLSSGHVTAWIIPLLLSGLFLLLFASANPLIERSFTTFDFRKSLSEPNFFRVSFWAVMVSLVWPFIAVRWKPRKPRVGVEATLAEGSPAIAEPESAFSGPQVILRSLVLFNLMFAVQTVLDFVYLWGGVALPDGMTYASYAHRGAYPLMLTALLAAVFILIAIRPGGPAERQPAIRILVFVWIAQNVILVISSMLRLDLYVQSYSLTYWRIAALIWMMLVALGLLLIVARMVLDRPNSWLVGANLFTLTIVLYCCAFINFPWVIATYNVEHSREVSGQGALLDFYYLTSLGPQALPAIDRYLRHPMRIQSYFNGQRDGVVQRRRRELDGWRAWSFCGWRLDRYLDQTGKD
jgi:hypothetical protein